MKTMVLILFFLDAGLHLTACWRQQKRLAAWTKIFLMPLLAVSVLPLTSTGRVFLFCGLLFGAAGDLFLLKPEKRPLFFAGLAAFAAGHLFYTVLFVTDTLFSHVQVWQTVLFCGLYLAVIVLVYAKLYPFLPQGIKVPPIFYMLMICTTSCFAVLRMLSEPDGRTLLAACGTVFFLISDTRLAFELFKGRTRYSSFFVMLTYLLAQASIALSFV